MSIFFQFSTAVVAGDALHVIIYLSLCWKECEFGNLGMHSILGNLGMHSVDFSYSCIFLAEKENLCLYGLPNETWEVNLPVEEVPPELPEPALGINFARDGMQEKDWLSLVAVHSDSWLLSVAFYFGARFGFGKSER